MFKFVVGFLLVVCVVSLPTTNQNEGRVVGGHDIDISEAPYQISLLDRGRHICGGSIVAPDLIVTAAHCVYGSYANQYQIRVGSSSIKNGGKVVEVADLIWHTEFSYFEMDNDIALLYLNDPLEFSENVAPIDLPDEDYEIEEGDVTVVTGWGSTKEGGFAATTLQLVEVPAVSEDRCKEAYEPFYDITPRMLCAGTKRGGKDACQGDSGGPLVHNDVLSGVVSWGIGCARPDYPGVYAKVSALRSWIDHNASYLRTRNLLRKGNLPIWRNLLMKADGIMNDLELA